MGRQESDRRAASPRRRPNTRRHLRMQGVHLSRAARGLASAASIFLSGFYTPVLMNVADCGLEDSGFRVLDVGFSTADRLDP
eukprot:7833065-Alexandrium_andersonii.AAC.1